MSGAFDFRSRSGVGGADPQARPQVAELTRPVFFVGFMGAGKTSTARKLARLAGLSAIDMDTYIERQVGKNASQIFADSGEAAFRTIETQVLRHLLAGDPALVSCGGGVVVTPENRVMLREGGYVVYLQVTADEAAERINNYSTRPLFKDLEAARRLIQERLPLYEEVADAAVDTAGRGSGAVAREVFGLLKRAGVLVNAAI